MLRSYQVGSWCPLCRHHSKKSRWFLFQLWSQHEVVIHIKNLSKELTSHHTLNSRRSKPKHISHLSSEMADGRRPDGSYGPEYGPQPPDHDYALYRHMPSRGRDPWPLNHGVPTGTCSFPLFSFIDAFNWSSWSVSGSNASFPSIPNRLK